MATYKTPGVYVEEIAKFPPSVAQVETAIPAFIGYTEKALKANGDTLHLQAKRITSLLEYEAYFGSAQAENIRVDVSDSTDENGVLITREVKVHQPDTKSPFLMYYSLQLYFANGGGPCYITSVGQYGDNPERLASNVDADELVEGLGIIGKVDEPTLLLFPDATALSSTDFYSVYDQAINQCQKLQDRFTIHDLRFADETTDSITEFRDNVTSETDKAKYCAAYYPFLETILNYRYNETSVKINHTSTFPNAVPFALSKLKDDYKSSLLDIVEKLRKTPTAPEGSLYDVIDFLNSDTKFDLDGTPSNFNVSIKDEFLPILKVAIDDLNKLIILKDLISTETNSAIDSIDESPISQTSLIAALKTFTDNFTVGPNKIEETYSLLLALYDKLLKDNTATKIENSIHLNATSSSNVKAQMANMVVSNGTTFTTDAFSTLIAALDGIISLVEAADIASTDVNNGEMNGRTLAQITNLDNASYNKIKFEINALPLTLPPSSAMAGIYARIDSSRGVWKAPANVNLAYVSKPTVNITHEEQADMNVHTTGKSVNAIRTFTGKGTMVWGARTLAGNDNEWRYVPVRRFFNMVEESVKKASEQFVFEGNDANTWVRIRAMIENFLNLQWRAGALTGAKPEQAYYVRVGLGQTMTAEDILNGYMNIEIGMAVVRPAEFIVLKFSHKMQEA